VKLATIEQPELRHLSAWLLTAITLENEIELHVVAQGWVFRCAGLNDLLIRAYREGTG
jgi:hypothetical protein